MSFDWVGARSAFDGFGGTEVTLRVTKSGLPFFDALRLYGAIDLYLGLREETSICDAGAEWVVTGQRREHRVLEKPFAAVKQVWTKKRPVPEELAKRLAAYLTSGQRSLDEPKVKALRALKGIDAVLQAGIRDTSAASYKTLQTSQVEENTCCVAAVPLSDGILAAAGQARIETVGEVVFLPIFEGRVDFGKVVSPIRAWVSGPSVLCAQALMLLMLKTGLFAEGYERNLTGVVFTTRFNPQKRANYSGLVAISSTAIGRISSPGLVSHLAATFKALVQEAWKRGKATPFVSDALTTASWAMQPVSKNLTSMLSSQERLRAARKPQLFNNARWVREVFEMTYGEWRGDHEAVRALAKAVASAIFHARMADFQAKRDYTAAQKAWYDEVVMLRSSPSPKAFVERSLILLEQGHREHSQVGTHHRQEDFDPRAIVESIGQDRAGFETFRDLFRMYLLQASTREGREAIDRAAEDQSPAADSGGAPEEGEDDE